jgi:hypothetical protein
MNTFTACRRLAVAAALLGYLGLGTAQQAAADDTINQYGYWASVLDTTSDGHRICGVRTDLDGGAQLRLMVVGDAVHLVAHDPNWDLPDNATSRVMIVVDDQTFNGTAEVVDGQTLLVTNLTKDFLEQFVDGSEMLANFGGVRWSVNLVGSGRATSDMASCIAATRSGLVS